MGTSWALKRTRLVRQSSIGRLPCGTRGQPQSEASVSTTEKLSLPFRPRARLLQLLGDQLIGTPRLAVFELVKNAYDADASSVAITLNDIESPTASIAIEDDGEGMTLETLRDIW